MRSKQLETWNRVDAGIPQCKLDPQFLLSLQSPFATKNRDEQHFSFLHIIEYMRSPDTSHFDTDD